MIKTPKQREESKTRGYKMKSLDLLPLRMPIGLTFVVPSSQ